jgi:hypothetical protein
MAHFFDKSILCYSGWLVSKVRNFYVFFKKFLLCAGRCAKPVRKQEGEEKNSGCIKTAEPPTQYIQYGESYHIRKRSDAIDFYIAP